MTGLMGKIAGGWLVSILVGLPLWASMGLAALAFLWLAGMPVTVLPQKMAGSMNSFPIVAGSPPSLHRSERDESARNRTQPSCTSSQADRSVASGAARVSPMNGRRRNVPRLAISSPTASATAC